MNNNLTPLQRILYHVCFAAWYCLSSLPLWIHYRFADVAAFLLYHVIRYRRRLVRRQLTDSFPDKPLSEIIRLEKDFYTHFCDIMVESVKYMSISEKELSRRLKFKGLDTIAVSAANGKSCGIFLGHYANWEWISSVQRNFDKNNIPIKCLQLYHPLENPVFNKLINYTRERWGSTNVPVNESIRHMTKYRMEGKPILVGFIADQAPFWNNIHYWTNFLNHPETPVFTGPERLMRKMKMDIYYLDIKKISRGHYEADFKLMTNSPADFAEFELTELYNHKLEESIISAPAYWLWSHNRWKRTKEEWERMYDAEKGKVYMNKVL